MGEDPEQLKRDIEATRRELSADVDALTEKVSPARVMERRVDRTKDAVSNLKEKVMGSSTTTKTSSGLSTVTSTVGDKAGSMSDAASSAKSSVTDAAGSAKSSISGAASSVSDAPAMAKRKAEGNPMAAGLIAFGVGWLVSSLLPASAKEQQVASSALDAAKDKADIVKEHLGEMAGEIKENLREPAQQAVESVKSTATDAAATVKDEARSAGADVAGQAKSAGQTVKEGASSGSSSPSYAETSTGSASTYGSSYSESETTQPYDLGQNPSDRHSTNS
jgi:hypothetical protein